MGHLHNQVCPIFIDIYVCEHLGPRVQRRCLDKCSRSYFIAPDRGINMFGFRQSTVLFTVSHEKLCTNGESKHVGSIHWLKVFAIFWEVVFWMLRAGCHHFLSDKMF